MTQYQKIVAIIFRMIGVMVVTVGLIYLVIWGFTFGLYWMRPMMGITVFLPYLLGGVALFLSSKLLAKLVCFELDKTDEK